jgi:release factor glutamine methyltransferase
MTPSAGSAGGGAASPGGGAASPGGGAASPSVRQVLLDVARRLGSAAEARWVLEHALGGDVNANVVARTDRALDPAQLAAVDAVVARRSRGEPLQYLLGSWAFRRLELAVDERVLIPRPETEVVCGYALDELARAAADGPADAPVRVVDLGTGSGAIALSLAVEGPGRVGGAVEVWAVDRSEGALAVAGANADAVAAAFPQAAPVRLATGSWFDALPVELAGTVTLVVANPPYVAEEEWPDLPVEVRHEPRMALVSGPTGREALEHIVAEAPRWLAPWGVLVLELAPHQAEDLALRALVDGFDGVIVRNDLAGRARALVARRWP